MDGYNLNKFSGFLRTPVKELRVTHNQMSWINLIVKAKSMSAFEVFDNKICKFLNNVTCDLVCMKSKLIDIRMGMSVSTTSGNSTIYEKYN